MAHFRLGDLESAEEELREADRPGRLGTRSPGGTCAMQSKAGLMEAARVTKMDLERRFQERTELIRSAAGWSANQRGAPSPGEGRGEGATGSRAPRICRSRWRHV